MNPRGLALVLGLSLLSALGGEGLAADLSKDVPGATDLPGVPRFAGSVLIGYGTSEQEQTIIPKGPWVKSAKGGSWKETIEVEGRRTRLLYLAPRGASALDIARGYQKLLYGEGYKRLFECSGTEACGAGIERFYVDEAHGKKLGDGHLLKNVYSEGSVQEPQLLSVQRTTPEGERSLFIFAAFQDNYADSAAGDRVAVFVEEVLTRPKPAPGALLKALEMAQGMAQSGRVALYGIRFDAEQASLRAESQPQLEELARMLSEQPGIEVYVVGHTDNAGTLDANLELSRRRAEAVTEALIQSYGIIGARLTPRGVASLAPLASNATEEGRAKNRRIELVVK